jgi:hypothetical protein
LSQREQRDFKLQIGRDLRRFEDLTAVITRFASQDTSAANSTLPRMSAQYYEDYTYDGEYYEDFWQGDSWDDYDYGYDDWQEDYYQEWPGEELQDEWIVTDWEESNEVVVAEDDSQELYGEGKGKGKKGSKGKGKAGCTACGSRFHMSDDCPLNASGSHDHGSKGKGKGKGKDSYFGSPFGKGKSFKGKGDKQSKGKGKGKGKRKGKGKGKGKKGKFRPSFGGGFGGGPSKGGYYGEEEDAWLDESWSGSNAWFTSSDQSPFSVNALTASRTPSSPSYHNLAAHDSVGEGLKGPP